MTDLIGSISDPIVPLFREHADARLRGIVIQVAVSAGDGNAGAAGDDPRPDDETLADGIPKIYRQERERADVANRGEAGFEGLAGVHDAGECTLERSVFEIVDLVIAIGARSEVGMAIDQAGEQRSRPEINDLGAILVRSIRRRNELLDTISFDKNGLPGHVPARG